MPCHAQLAFYGVLTLHDDGVLMRRSAQELQSQGQLAAFTGTLWRFPLVYLIIFIVRFLLICLFRPLFRLSRQDLPFKEIAFATVAGLRGSVSLILTQAVVIDPGTRNTDRNPDVTVRWFSGLSGVSCSVNYTIPNGVHSQGKWAGRHMLKHGLDGGTARSTQHAQFHYFLINSMCY